VVEGGDANGRSEHELITCALRRRAVYLRIEDKAQVQFFERRHSGTGQNDDGCRLTGGQLELLNQVGVTDEFLSHTGFRKTRGISEI